MRTEEIKNSLRCCAADNCIGCMWDGRNPGTCMQQLAGTAADKIEQLQQIITDLTAKYGAHHG